MRCLMWILCSILGFSMAHAQVQMEVLRSTEPAGYGIVNLFPAGLLAPLQTTEVFIDQIAPEDQIMYKKITQRINLSGGHLISDTSKISDYLDAPRLRVFALGSPSLDYPFFVAEDAFSATDQFLIWSREHQPNIYADAVENPFTDSNNGEIISLPELTTHGQSWVYSKEKPAEIHQIEVLRNGVPTTLDIVQMQVKDASPEVSLDIKQVWIDAHYGGNGPAFWVLYGRWIFVIFVLMTLFWSLIYSARMKRKTAADPLLREEIPMKHFS